MNYFFLSIWVLMPKEIKQEIMKEYMNLANMFKSPEDFNKIIAEREWRYDGLTEVNISKEFNSKTQRVLQVEKAIKKTSKILEDLEEKIRILQQDYAVYTDNIKALYKIRDEWVEQL